MKRERKEERRKNGRGKREGGEGEGEEREEGGGKGGGGRGREGEGGKEKARMSSHLINVIAIHSFKGQVCSGGGSKVRGRLHVCITYIFILFIPVAIDNTYSPDS